MDTSISVRVRDRIQQSGMSQGQVAAALELSPSQLSKSLNGARQFSAVELAQLADLLQESMHWLVTGEEDPLAPRLVARHAFDHDRKAYTAEGLEKDRQLLADLALVYRQACA